MPGGTGPGPIPGPGIYTYDPLEGTYVLNPILDYANQVAESQPSYNPPPPVPDQGTAPTTAPAQFPQEDLFNKMFTWGTIAKGAVLLAVLGGAASVVRTSRPEPTSRRPKRNVPKA